MSSEQVLLVKAKIETDSARLHSMSIDEKTELYVSSSVLVENFHVHMQPNTAKDFIFVLHVCTSRISSYISLEAWAAENADQCKQV